MRLALSALAAIAVPIAASGQPQAPITATPLPPTVQYPGPQAAPAQPAQPPAPAPPGSGPGATGSPGIAASPPPAAWVPQAIALLQVLDKVNAQNATLTVKVGQSAQFGSLTIAVQTCQIRPPDRPQDATAYLTISDSHADAPGFRGWMLANHPSLSMLQHPIYDVRVVGCRA